MKMNQVKTTTDVFSSNIKQTVQPYEEYLAKLQKQFNSFFKKIVDFETVN